MDSSPLSNIKRSFALDEIRGLEYFRSVKWVETIDSTNRELAKQVREQAIELPALLVSDSQSAGVGRGANQWWSPSGCLMFSMAVPISSPSQDGDADASQTRSGTPSALLPLRVGFAIAECAESLCAAKPLVKWPNDVYIAGKKVCGILIETIPQYSAGQSVAIIGIGLNCSVDFADAPLSLQQNATSLHRWSKSANAESTSVESVLVHFLHRWIANEQRQLESPDWLVSEWPNRSLLDNQWVEIKHASGVTRGRCLGIDKSGALLIQNEQLEQTAVLAGTVEAFRPLYE